MLKTIGMRFIRGFYSGAIGSMIIVLAGSASGVAPVASWVELSNWINVLGLAGVSGGIIGGLMALDKAIRYKR